jgi:hypothetical protein
MKDHRYWQNLIMPDRQCKFNYHHVPVPVRLNIDCGDGASNGPNIWLLFWQQDETEIPYRWETNLYEARFGGTRLVHLNQSESLADNLGAAGKLIMADNVPAWRQADNALTQASLQASLANVAEADALLTALNRSEISSDLAHQAEMLQQHLPYLNGPPLPDHTVKATWGEEIQLRGYTVQTSPGHDSMDHLTVTLFWLAMRQPEKEYTIFLHWRDNENTNLAQIDFRPYDGLLSTQPWRPGQMIRETRVLNVPNPDPHQIYKLVAGIYDLETLQRLPLANDHSHENTFELNWQ